MTYVRSNIQLSIQCEISKLHIIYINNHPFKCEFSIHLGIIPLKENIFHRHTQATSLSQHQRDTTPNKAFWNKNKITQCLLKA